MNIGIIGAGGIGKFHIREFSNLGCKNIFLLNSSYESGFKLSELLSKEYNLKITPCKNLTSFLNQNLTLVSICTPLNFHEKFVKACLEKKINVLCEKPLTIKLNQAKKLILLAKKNKKLLQVNTQWPTILNNLSYMSPIKTFEMNMQSGVKGKNMLLESIPHLNSMLIKLFGIGKIKNLNWIKKKNHEIILTFQYIKNNQKCLVKYSLTFNDKKPKELSFRINGSLFEREVDDNYNQYLINEKKKIKIEDPLKLSIQHFLDSIEKKQKPFFDYNEIIANLELQEKILSNYD